MNVSAQEKEREVGYTQLELSIFNAGEYPAKFFTMFPGAYTQVLKPSARSKFTPTDYVFGDPNSNADPTEGVWMQVDDSTDKAILQHHNQWMYWRINSVYDGTPL